MISPRGVYHPLYLPSRRDRRRWFVTNAIEMNLDEHVSSHTGRTSSFDEESACGDVSELRRLLQASAGCVFPEERSRAADAVPLAFSSVHHPDAR